MSTVLNRRPHTEYVEADDLTLYRRRDGQRLIIVSNFDWNDCDMIRNTLIAYNEKRFIDYTIGFDGDKMYCECETVAKQLHLPYLGFSGVVQMIKNGLPTGAILFTDSTDWAYYFIHHLESEHVPFEIVRH